MGSTGDAASVPQYPELNGKRVVVTGAGKGIGAHCVGLLLQQGCHVIAISRTQSDLDKLASKYASNTNLQTVKLDISVWDDVENVFNSLDPFHYLINNAGVAVLGPFLKFSEQDYETVLGTNLKGCMHVAQCAAKQMVANNIKGTIVNVSSQASQKSFQDHTLYCCSKAALDMLTKVIALELGPKGIRCVSVNPTVVMTDLGRKAWSDPQKGGPMLARIPLGRFAEIEDVTKTILFCLSDGAAMITGSTIDVDGGVCAQ